ncbi:MAG: UDP-N-acetylglucosamine pyrophosphorylase [Clostridiales bacterium]|nr:UDP-N-acetylglucosamine pyrophosphorylase [Clostridiales bacterium]
MNGNWLIENLLDLTHTRAAELFADKCYAWEVLAHIKDCILQIGAQLNDAAFERRGEDIWIHRTAKVAPSASITGPCIIDAETEVRHCAFIRGSALIGKNCVVGNSAEIKNAILFDNVQTPHYNYIGDSVLGYKSHLGAGAVTSNVKSDRSLVTVRDGELRHATGLKKFGAIVGDFAEVGCNAVLNPGTVLSRHSSVYPTTCARGTVPENGILKNDGRVVIRD